MMKRLAFGSLVIFLSLCQLSHQGMHHLLAKKFVGVKLFKKLKALDQCEVVWENVEHPHCETSWRQKCSPVSRTECDTEYVEKCTEETETQCRTEEVEQCETKHVDFCETEAVEHCIDTVETRCEEQQVEECWEELENDCKTKKECGTKLDEVCSTITKWVCDKPKPEPEPEPESRHSSRSSDFKGTSLFTNPLKKIMKRSAEKKLVKNVEDEMMTRFENLSMRDLLDLSDKMNEEDFDEAGDNADLERSLQSRSKRGIMLGHLAGAVGLSALYNKFLSTQEECRQVEVPHCAEVPVETCHDVRTCQEAVVPRCRQVVQEVCRDQPGEMLICILYFTQRP